MTKMQTWKTDTKFKNFVRSVLNFKNEKKEPIADYITLTNGKLWRRGKSFLVSYTLSEDKNQENYSYDYSFYDEENEHKTSILLQSKQIELLENGKLKLRGEECFSAIKTNYLPNSIKILKEQNYQKKFQIETELLCKQILDLNLEVKNENISLETIDVLCTEEGIFRSKETKGQLYSFELIQRLLANAEDLSEQMNVFEYPHFIRFLGNSNEEIVIVKKRYV